MNKPNVSIKIIFNSKIVKSIASRKMRRINKFIEANNFQNCLYKVRVTYQKGITNCGDYKTKSELLYALKSFLEI